MIFINPAFKHHMQSLRSFSRSSHLNFVEEKKRSVLDN